MTPEERSMVVSANASTWERSAEDVILDRLEDFLEVSRSPARRRLLAAIRDAVDRGWSLTTNEFGTAVKVEHFRKTPAWHWDEGNRERGYRQVVQVALTPIRGKLSANLSVFLGSSWLHDYCPVALSSATAILAGDPDDLLGDPPTGQPAEQLTPSPAPEEPSPWRSHEEVAELEYWSALRIGLTEGRSRLAVVEDVDQATSEVVERFRDLGLVVVDLRAVVDEALRRKADDLKVSWAKVEETVAGDRVAEYDRMMLKRLFSRAWDGVKQVLPSGPMVVVGADVLTRFAEEGRLSDFESLPAVFVAGDDSLPFRPSRVAVHPLLLPW